MIVAGVILILYEGEAEHRLQRPTPVPGHHRRASDGVEVSEVT